MMVYDDGIVTDIPSEAEIQELKVTYSMEICKYLITQGTTWTPLEFQIVFIKTEQRVYSWTLPQFTYADEPDQLWAC